MPQQLTKVHLILLKSEIFQRTTLEVRRTKNNIECTMHSMEKLNWKVKCSGLSCQTVDTIKWIRVWQTLSVQAFRKNCTRQTMQDRVFRYVPSLNRRMAANARVNSIACRCLAIKFRHTFMLSDGFSSPVMVICCLCPLKQRNTLVIGQILHQTYKITKIHFCSRWIVIDAMKKCNNFPVLFAVSFAAVHFVSCYFGVCFIGSVRRALPSFHSDMHWSVKCADVCCMFVILIGVVLTRGSCLRRGTCTAFALDGCGFDAPFDVLSLDCDRTAEGQT